jgi:hypothetical protein
LKIDNNIQDEQMELIFLEVFKMSKWEDLHSSVVNNFSFLGMKVGDI